MSRIPHSASTRCASILLLAVLSLSVTAIAGKPAPPPPPEPDWEFIPELGGWLDWNTGLVWGPNLYDIFGTSASWDYANDVLIPAYCDLSGFDDWRFPTTAEIQNAAQADFAAVAYPGVTNDASLITWSSRVTSTSAYYGNLETGQITKTSRARSFLNTTPVRRAF